MIPYNQEKWIREWDAVTETCKREKRSGWKERWQSAENHSLVLERNILRRRGVRALIWSKLGCASEKISGWWSFFKAVPETSPLPGVKPAEGAMEGWERGEKYVSLRDCGFLCVSSDQPRVTAKMWLDVWDKGLRDHEEVCVCVCMLYEWKQKEICLIRQNSGAQPACCFEVFNVHRLWPKPMTLLFLPLFLYAQRYSCKAG